MSVQDLKDLILGWIPDNVMRLISPERARNAYYSIIEFFWDITGNKSDLETTDKSSLVNAINELKQTGGFVITEIILTNGQSFLFPAMSKGEAFVIRIIENDTPSQNGMVWLGGYDGVSVGNDTVVICVSNSLGGSYSDVGHQFVIINQGKESEVIFVDELPDENLARTGVIYILNSNNAMYIWDNQLGDYVLIGDVVPGTLISSTVFEDENNNVVIPEANKLYFDTTSEIYYRWDGTQYVPIIGLDSIEEVSATNPGIVNNEPLQELGGVDKLINGVRVGRGGGDVQTNTVLGENALQYNQSGYRNTAIGNEAMLYNDSGANNTAVGDLALWYLDSGSLNTAVGESAMMWLQKGSSNTSLGYAAGFRLYGEDVEYNTLIGAESGGVGFSSFIEGKRNTIIGGLATSNLSTGSNNVTVGYKSANSLRTGNHNIIIGVQSGDKTTLTPPADATWDFGDRNIFIGRLAGVWEVPNLAEDYLLIHSYHNQPGEDKTPLILGHFTDRFLRVGGELELDPQFLPTPDATFNKKLVYNPTDGKVTAVDDTSGGGIQSIVPGDNISVDNTDPQNPIISSTGGDSNLTLEQARQNGNVLEGDVVIENFSSGQNETGFISEGGSSKITFTDEEGVLINKLQANTNSYINVYSNYASLGINDYALDNQISIEASYINNEPSILISTSGKEETKGLIGSKEFNKQGDRKAYVQMGDIEDFYKTIPGYDEEATQTLKHVKGVLQWVIDK